MKKIATSMPAGHVDFGSLSQNLFDTTKQTGEIRFTQLIAAIGCKTSFQFFESQKENLFNRESIPNEITKKLIKRIS